MNKKEILFGVEARNKMLSGLEKTYNAVSSTLGPCGRTVVIKQPNESPTITKDGVTVAREIKLEDNFEDLGVELLREVSMKTNDKAGDGTTTSTVLAYSIAKEGLKAISAGAKPIAIKRGIDKATEIIVNEVKKISKEINGAEDIKNVARISANNDDEFGSLVSEAFSKVGKNGVISISESKSTNTTVKIVNGLEFDSGYLSPYFVTDKNLMTVDYTDPYILVTDRSIGVLNDLVSVLEGVAKSGKPLVIIADNVEGEALAALVVNTLRGALKVVAVKAPSYGDSRADHLHDICALTGATLISDNTGIGFSQVTLKELGTCSSVKVTKDETTLVGANEANRENLDKRIIELEEKLKDPNISSFDKDHLQDRLAKLSDGVALIEVGAVTETELKEKRFRLEDTLQATRAAVEEGIVPGGGVTLIKASEAITEEVYNKYDLDIQTGFKIVKEAVKLPLCKIAENAGMNGYVIVDKIEELNKNNSDYNTIYCYDAYNDRYELASVSGIVDPTKVTRCSIQNAASIAGLLITSECCIVDKETKEDN